MNAHNFFSIVNDVLKGRASLSVARAYLAEAERKELLVRLCGAHGTVIVADMAGFDMVGNVGSVLLDGGGGLHLGGVFAAVLIRIGCREPARWRFFVNMYVFIPHAKLWSEMR